MFNDYGILTRNTMAEVIQGYNLDQNQKQKHTQKVGASSSKTSKARANMVQRLGRVGDESAESYPSRPTPRRETESRVGRLNSEETD